MRWLWKTLVFGLASPFVANTALADGRGTDAAAIRATAQSIQNYKTVDPVLPTYLTNNDPYQCPASGIVAFSAYGEGHVSEGSPSLLTYPSVITNEGGGWPNGGGTFVAPCAGLYFFTISFMKDAFQFGGTSDDVHIFLYRNGVFKGSAWSGQSIDTDRSPGTFSVTLMLEQGDYIQTFAASDSGRKRHITRFDFTGYLVRQRN